MTYPPPEYPVVPRTVRTCRARWTSDDRSQERAESEQSGVGTGTSWQQILLGHLEVLDRSDRDGRGYLVLRRVQSSAKGTLTLRQRRALTLRAAGHAYKFIAYELGISNSTASLDVAEGMAATPFVVRLTKKSPGTRASHGTRYAIRQRPLTQSWVSAAVSIGRVECTMGQCRGDRTRGIAERYLLEPRADA